MISHNIQCGYLKFLVIAVLILKATSLSFEYEYLGEGDYITAADIVGLETCVLNRDIIDHPRIVSQRQALEKCNALKISCDIAVGSKYRSIDGSCNNLKYPTWGKSKICLQRILPHDYADGISYPRTFSSTGEPLPNTRLISNLYHRELTLLVLNYTTLFLEWGQIIAHDLSLNDVFRDEDDRTRPGFPCCRTGPLINDKCISLAIPPNDPFYPKFNQTCLSFTRSIPCRCSSEQRGHLNENTAFLDLSTVYGNSGKEAKNLRSFKLGMLRVEDNPLSGPMPPTVEIEDLCVSPKEKNICYKTGDRRANMQPLLVTVHVYLLRYHNYICNELHRLNKDWDDEKLYQEARRINIAIAQYITYGHYLPIVFGESLDEYGLRVSYDQKYTEYDPNLNPSIDDEFTTAANRYGHTLIPGTFTEINPETLNRETKQLRNHFNTPFGFKKGRYDSVIQGMTADHIMEHDPLLSDDVRNFLFRNLFLNETTGRDLAALSITRGRDHGIPGYTHYVTSLLNVTINSFDDLTKLIPKERIEKLKGIYQCVHDIDLYVGGLSEYHLPGGLAGPTFSYLIGQQYKKLKYGDRYFFTHGGLPGSFTLDELNEIKKISVSRIVCDTSKVRRIQKQAFRLPSERNPVVSCDELPKIDFRFWEEVRE